MQLLMNQRQISADKVSFPLSDDHRSLLIKSWICNTIDN